MMKQSIIFMLAAALIFAECAAGAGEVPRPDKGMSPEQLIKVWYEIEFTRFARDYKNYNTFFLLDRNGARRERKAYRSRIACKETALITRTLPYFFRPHL